MIPSVAPRYRILQEVGRGGMGVVFNAEDLKLHRIVALKFLPEDLTASDDDIARFHQEAEVIPALNHPNIATIYDIDEAEGRKFLALEFLSGGTLNSIVKQYLSEGNEIPIRDVVQYGVQIAEGLSHAHREEIIHRDVKTDNVISKALIQVKNYIEGISGNWERRSTPDHPQWKMDQSQWVVHVTCCSISGRAKTEKTNRLSFLGGHETHTDSHRFGSYSKPRHCA